MSDPRAHEHSGDPVPATDRDGWPAPNGSAGSGPAGPADVWAAPVAAPSRRRLNPLAVASLVTAILALAPAAVVLGHVGLAQARRRSERGRGFAIAGLVLGYLGIVIAIALVIGYRAFVESLRSGGYLPA